MYLQRRKRNLTDFSLMTLISLTTPLASLSGSELSELASRIPPGANALVLIDVEQTLKAPLAQQQGWGRKLEAAYVERPVFLPPEASQLVLGAHLNPNSDFMPTWEVAVMQLPEPLSMRSIARSESGFVDVVHDTQTAWSPSGAAYASLDGGLLGVVGQAERQFVARWIEACQAGSRPTLSSYLEESLRLVTDRAQIVFAADLTDIIVPHNIEQRLAAADWFTKSGANAGEAAGLVSGLRGATLRVAVGENCQGQLLIDFSKDVAAMKGYARPLVFAVLKEIGLQTAPLEKWDFNLNGRQILMQGDLSADAMRRLFSVIELPKTHLGGTEGKGLGKTTEGATGEPTESEVREQSLTYFSASQVLVSDLRKGLKDTKATSAWMERYARRIDELPVLHVDEELLEYGDKLAETLRIMSLSQRQAGIRGGVRRAEGAGYYYYDSDAYERAAQTSMVKKEEEAVAQDTRVEGWRLIDDATADIRRKMTKKYQAEF